MPYELHGWGSDLGIDVRGPDVAACCAAAVEAFAASFVDVPARAARRATPVELRADDPAELLAEVLEEAIVRLDADGQVAVGLDATVVAGGLRGDMETVALGEARLTGAVPKAVTWHDLRLEQTGQGWHGHVVLDL